MKEKYVPENASKNVSLKSYTYRSPAEAIEVYKSFEPALKEQMAEVYRQAFAGPPWFEKFKCNDCDSFFATDSCCPGCKSFNIGEAYPTEELIEDYFPKTLAEFTPGVLATASDKNKVIGFVIGGDITLEKLVNKKYGGNGQILDSISNQGGLKSQSVLFYNNEFCVLPEKQNQGIGTVLASAQLTDVLKLKPDFITGRTINQSLLKIRSNGLTKAGYDFSYFVPDGDGFQVNGTPRFFYVGTRK